MNYYIVEISVQNLTFKVWGYKEVYIGKKPLQFYRSMSFTKFVLQRSSAIPMKYSFVKYKKNIKKGGGGLSKWLQLIT